MRELALILMLIITMLFGCSQNLKKIYIIETDKLDIIQLSGQVKIYSMKWSLDSTYLSFIDVKMSNDRIRVFQVSDFSEIDVPELLKQNEFNSKSFEWIDNSKMILFCSSDSKHGYFEYDVSNNSTKELSESEYRSYLNDTSMLLSSKNHNIYFPNNLIPEISKNLPEAFTKAILFRDKKRVLYSTSENDVYLYNLETEEKKFLFTGFYPILSPNESKIQYYKSSRVETSTLNETQNFSTTELETYIYDLEKADSRKFSDSCVESVFSYDDKYIIYIIRGYVGTMGV